MTVEEAWDQYLRKAVQPMWATNEARKAAAVDAMLAVLDEAETAYAQNYEGANEGDAVAMALEAIRTRIQALGEK